MPAYRSSTISLVEDHCPGALDHADAGAPYDREIFHAGVAAHAVLDGFCRLQRQQGEPLSLDEQRTVADAIVRELVTVGRSFEGEPEPPLPLGPASEGRDLALSAWAIHPTAIDDRSEHGLAVDAQWRPVPYSTATAWWVAAVDVVGLATKDDGGTEFQGLAVTDYKSAWPTNATELETLQLRGQALVALAHAAQLGLPSPAFVRRRVINLRTREAFEVDTWLDDDGLDTLAGWRRDIEHAIAIAETRDANGRRPYRPGATCLGCPYLIRCDAARAHLRGSLLDGSAEAIATRFAVADALRADLFEQCKALTAAGPIAVAGGLVGFVAKSERKPATTAAELLAHQWFSVADPLEWNAKNAALLGFLKVLNPGVKAAEAVAKVLHPSIRGSDGWKAARAALVAAATVTHSAPEFGVHRTPSTPKVSP